MVTKDISAYIKQQNDLRERLFTIVRTKQMSWIKLGKDIGISPMTLKKFLIYEHELLIKQFSKVSEWVNKNKID